MTVTVASKALNVGERGIYHARVVVEEGTEEEIADCDSSNLVTARARGGQGAFLTP